MKCFGLTLCLRDDPVAIASYQEYHRQVWPEVLAAIRAVGITEMKIFLRGTRMFMYVEAVDEFEPARDWERMNVNERTAEWDQLMRTLQERPPEASPDEWWAPMAEVFDLNWPPSPLAPLPRGEE